MARKPDKFPWPHELMPQAGRVFDLMSRGDDLTCAIMGGAFVDHCLASTLQSYLVNGETALGLLQPGRALGDMASRRQLCYSLGLIPASTGDDIEQIGLIRNIFAHKFLDVNFGDAKVAGLCMKLKAKATIEEWNKKANSPASPKLRFCTAVMVVTAELLLMASDVPHRKKKGEWWPKMKNREENSGE